MQGRYGKIMTALPRSVKTLTMIDEYLTMAPLVRVTAIGRVALPTKESRAPAVMLETGAVTGTGQCHESPAV